MTFSSDSPSLRSKRSDLSSHASSANPTGFTTVATNRNFPIPDSLPSPATTVGEYTGDFIEGWTTAQGRASAISSPIREQENLELTYGRIATLGAGSPPASRETILDRAFQMRIIPGSGHQIPGEKKLSSLARFDALMRESEGKKTKREADEQAIAESNGLQSAWDLDESSDDEAYTSDGPAHENKLKMEQVRISPNTQRALEFITSRHEEKEYSASRPNLASRNTVSYHADTFKSFGSGEPQRPATGYSTRRPSFPQRINSQACLPGEATRSPTSKVQLGEVLTENHIVENRESSSSAKRSSFTDFTKRLSNTSSLLLVQTNNSGANNEDETHSRPTSWTPLNAISGTMPSLPKSPHEEKDWENMKRCGWRGSVGVFGSEGGFL